MRRRHAPASRVATCAALLCAAGLCADAVAAHKPRASKAASTPSTAQILAPSAATAPDALPPDKTIYRCGNTYSPRPCADGGTQPIDVADPRSQDQRRQSEDVAARDKRLASWFEAGRRERETVATAPSPGRGAKPAKGCVPKGKVTCKSTDAVSRQTRTAVSAASGPAKSKSK